MHQRQLSCPFPKIPGWRHLLSSVYHACDPPRFSEMLRSVAREAFVGEGRPQPALEPISPLTTYAPQTRHGVRFAVCPFLLYQE